MTNCETSGIHNYQSSIISYKLKHGYGTFVPKAVLFDMDGVLYNSMPNHALSWHKAMQQYGIDMRPEEAYEYEGMRGVETIKLKARQQWQRELTDEEARQMYLTKTSLFAQCPPAEIMSGVKSLMKQMTECGLHIGVVTGSGQHTLLDKLASDFHGMIDENCIVTSFDVAQGKPAPDPYLAGMRKTCTEPWQTIVIENAPLGVTAAAAAGCFTIAVNTGPLPGSMLSEAGADIVVDSMPDMAEAWHTIYSILHS